MLYTETLTTAAANLSRTTRELNNGNEEGATV